MVLSGLDAGSEKPGPHQPDEATARAWEPPRICDLGPLGTRIQGFGKSGAAFDSDPNSTTKTGVG